MTTTASLPSSVLSTSLAGKTYLITGGTSGIGLAAAQVLAADGARVLVTGRSADGLATATQRLGATAIVIRSDAADPQAAEVLVTDVRRHTDRLDGAFINAGVGRFGPIEEMTPALFDQMFNTNVRGAYFTVRALLPLLTRGSSVVFNSSIVSRFAMQGAAVYSATKAALTSISRSLALELADRGIRVNTVSPGPIETPIFGKLGFDADTARATKDYLTQNTLLKRFGQPEEVAHLVRFLLSDQSSFIVGEEIGIDGGIQHT